MSHSDGPNRLSVSASKVLEGTWLSANKLTKHRNVAVLKCREVLALGIADDYSVTTFL